MKKECIAMLLAGGQGSRLYVLTENMAKPAVPFGGKFRIIDFPLSNCANAGIDTVGVLTQYRPLELNRYIGSGQNSDCSFLLTYRSPPYNQLSPLPSQSSEDCCGLLFFFSLRGSGLSVPFCRNSERTPSTSAAAAAYTSQSR